MTALAAAGQFGNRLATGPRRFGRFLRARWRLLLAGLCAYLLFLIVLLPAAWLAWAMERHGGGRLLAAGATGTLWHGELRGLVWRDGDNAAQLGRLSWRLRPAELARGRLGFEIALGGPTRDGGGDGLAGRLGIGFGGIHVERLSGRLPAALIGHFDQAIALLRPGGEVELDVRDFAFGRAGVAGAVEARWLDARSPLVNGRMGDYQLRVTATADGQGAVFALSTQRGPVHLAGHGDWQPGRPGNFTALFRLPDTPDYAQVRNLLGPRGADGMHTLRMNW